MEMTLEQRRAIALASARARAAKAAPAAAAVVPEEPGFFSRAADTVVTGVSDALSTAAGDTYGRKGDPTQRDNLDFVPTPANMLTGKGSRLTKAVGGDLLPAAGEVVGDAVISAGKAVLPESAQTAIGDAATAVANSVPVQAAGRGLAAWRKASPETYASAGEAANIVAMRLPLPGPKFVKSHIKPSTSTGRIAEKLIQPDGSFKPLTLAAPDSGIGRVYRDWLASVPFAKSALKAQEKPFLERAAQEVADQESIFNQQAHNLDRHQWHRVNDIDQNAAQEASRLQAAIDAERLNAAQAQDVAAATTAHTTAAESAALRQANEAQHLAALKASVPEARAGAVTQTGHAGYTQALEQINAAYDDAWGSVDGLTRGTVPALLDMTRFKADSLPTDSAAVLKRLGADIEKLNGADNVAGIDDKLRRLINSAKDHQLADDLREIRETLRLGLPADNATKLAQVDAVYPNFLAVQKGTAKAVETGGVPTRRQLLKSAAQVAGERRTARERIPLIDVLRTNAAPDLAAPSNAVPRRPVLERSLALAQEKRRAAAAARAARKDAAAIAQAEKAALKDVEKTGPLAKAREKVAALENAKSSPHSSLFSGLATAGGISSMLGGAALPYAASIGAGVGLGRLAVTKPAQLLVAGQLDLQLQKRLANALRAAANNTASPAQKALIIDVMNKDQEKRNAPRR